MLLVWTEQTLSAEMLHTLLFQVLNSSVAYGIIYDLRLCQVHGNIPPVFCPYANNLTSSHLSD